ncbi:MAG: hypothetical protein HRF43_06630 [Phycisphaerae bacterium]
MPASAPPAEGAPPVRPRRPLDLAGVFMMLGGGLVIGMIVFHAAWNPDINKKGRLDYCPNDASRWNTVFFLVEYGTYEYLPGWKLWWQGKTPKPPYDLGPFWTIDVVARRGEDGQLHYFSSKPPLFPTLMAGFVIATQKVSAWIEPAVRGALSPLFSEARRGKFPYRVSFRETPFFILPFTLIAFQAVPFMIFVGVMARRFREMTASAFVRDFCTATAALGTFLTPWCITLNNHVLGAFFALFALHAAMRIWYDGRRQWYWFALAGFFGAMAHTFELPALALTAAVVVGMIVKDRRRGLVGLVFALIPIAAELLTNHRALGTFGLAYADMGVYGPVKGGLYDYPGSYWMNPNGIDALKEPYRVYLLHLLVGHHSLFLLMPVLLVGLLGAGRHLRREGLPVAALLTSVVLAGLAGLVVYDVQQQGPVTAKVQGLVNAIWGDRAVQVQGGYALLAPIGLLFLVNLGMYMRPMADPRPLLALLALAVTSVLLVFYTFFQMRNYGGGAQGARWLFWVIPLWLLMMPAGLERLAAWRPARGCCYAALLVSMAGVAFVFRMPWTYSWAHLLFRHLGWINY